MTECNGLLTPVIPLEEGDTWGQARALLAITSYLRLLACPNQRGTRFLYIRYV
jgi:hypothetical protein